MIAEKMSIRQPTTSRKTLSRSRNVSGELTEAATHSVIRSGIWSRTIHLVKPSATPRIISTPPMTMPHSTRTCSVPLTGLRSR
jgi:hypothetical protein